MYGIFTYIWLIFVVNVGIYTPYMDPTGLIPKIQKDALENVSKFSNYGVILGMYVRFQGCNVPLKKRPGIFSLETWPPAPLEVP